MKLLIVAMAESIHTARWMAQIADQGWDIHLFPSIDYGIVHPDIRHVTVYHSFYSQGQSTTDQHVTFRGFRLYYEPLTFLVKKLLHKWCRNYRLLQLKSLVRKLRPDIIHSLEFQHSSYLTLAAKKKMGADFPAWMVTNWGSDIYLYGRLAKHKQMIRDVLAESDYYVCECNRDVQLAIEHGFQGTILPVFPNTGGFNLKKIASFRQKGRVSHRRLIVLKGYQTWSGRALVGLRALERCSDLLVGYEVAIYSANTTDVLIAAELFAQSTGIKVRIIPPNSTHDDILRLHGQARVSIGLSISDAISTSFIEALVMGSFPIQSFTSCADEWIENGKTGILVPPEDTEVIERAIRIALTDDQLVDQASIKNLETCNERLEYDMLKAKTLELYTTVQQENSY